MRFPIPFLVSFFSVMGGLSAQNFRVVGTEPFWGMTVTNRSITFEALGLGKRTFRYIPPTPAAGKPADLVRVYQLGAGNTLILQKVDNCSDGMSDKNYPYSALFINGGRVWSGCASNL
jgi:uncharacterized membrane protein